MEKALFRQRVEKMQAALAKKKIDAALLINTTIKDPNMLYFTDLELEYSFFVIPQKGEAVFFVSSLEYERAKRYAPCSSVLPYKKPLQEINKVLKGKKNVGINEQYVTLSMDKALRKEMKGHTFKPLQDVCRALRIIKSSEEIHCLQTAAKIADDLFETLCKELRLNRKQFVTEIDIADFIAAEAKKRRTVVSFETIVASGKNAALPHYIPQPIRLQKGFCVLDFGVRSNNYISDISRTIYFGKPSADDLRFYNQVQQANERAFAAVTLKKKFSAIDAVSRKEIDYPHSLGHGIGIEVHEAPNVGPKSKDSIQENMCFTIEPGLYVPEQFGIRIEDDVWMTKTGPVLLTKSSKELFSFDL